MLDEGLKEILNDQVRLRKQVGTKLGHQQVGRLRLEELGEMQTQKAAMEKDIYKGDIETEGRRTEIRDAMFVLQILRDDMMVWSAEVD